MSFRHRSRELPCQTLPCRVLSFQHCHNSAHAAAPAARCNTTLDFLPSRRAATCALGPRGEAPTELRSSSLSALVTAGTGVGRGSDTPVTAPRERDRSAWETSRRERQIASRFCLWHLSTVLIANARRRGSAKYSRQAAEGRLGTHPADTER